MAQPDIDKPPAGSAALRPPDRASRGRRRHARPATDGRPAGLPAAWQALDWRPLATIRNRTKPAVYVAGLDGRRVVCKDASGIRRGPWRLFRRLTLRREARTLARLAGIEGVPALLASWPTGLVMEAVPGRMLTTWCRGTPPPPGTFERLDRIIALAHARGIVLGDVHRRNILVDDDGRVHLVDFEVSVDVSRGPARLLARLGTAVDRIAAARQRVRHGVPLAPGQADLLARSPWPYRVLRRLKRRVRRARRGRRRA
jgi:predicted Ser/Thr protein kinase